MVMPERKSAHTEPPAIAATLAQAQAIVEAQGGRLTTLRREVLRLILAAETPIGAYDLLARLRESHGRAAPPTVYRALDFLLVSGLIHRITRLSAFMACIGHEPGHAAQFLICRDCGAVIEIDAPDITTALKSAASARGFTIAGATIEAEGRCADCAARDCAAKA
jgi:Fur family zinc uptake transcriptional regulator